MTLPDLRKPTIRSSIVSLLAGASLGALAVTAPSYAVNVASAPTAAAPIEPVSATWSDAPASLADMVERVSPSVVQIMVRQGGPLQRVSGPGDRDDLPPGLRDFFGKDFQFFFGEPRNWQRRTPDRIGSGSGFFIEGGYIVTNNHVVDNARKLQVRFDGGQEVEGTLVGTDPKTDLAVVKVDAKYARKPLTWGDSNRARIGENVFTIGAPFSLGNSVTAGIISARGRDISSGPYDDYFQIDAPINPGNSGGPMFNSAGEVIGVNTAIYSPSGGNVGIGFSIPAQQASAVVRQIIDKGYVERGWLGVNIQRVTPDIAGSLGLPEARGALVAEIDPKGPAAKSGLRLSDVVIAYGDRPVGTLHDLTRAVADTRPGETRNLRVIRNGKEQAVSVRIAALEQPKPARIDTATSAESGSSGGSGLGIEVRTDDRGLVIADIASASAAEEAGLRVGDRLLMVNQTKVETPQEARSAVAQARAARRAAVLVQVEREGARIFIAVPLTA
jgi:serine protease Do